jgi:hypothetical protein
MPTRQQFIPIDEAIYGYIDAAELSPHKYFKLWNIAADAVTQLGLDFFSRIKSVKLPINANKTVTLPEDYLNYSKVGVLNHKGEVIPMGYNDNLTGYAALLPDRIEKTQDNELWIENPSCPVYFNYWDGSGLVNLYGLPSGSPSVGNFKILNHEGVILLDESFGYDYIILEYVASPSAGTDLQIPIQFKQAVISYLAWKDIAYLPSSRRGSISDKETRKRDFYNERRLAAARYKPFNFNEAYEWSLQNQRRTIKG